MQPAPLRKLLDSPLLSLDGTSVEMASLLFLFLAVIIASGIERRRQLVRHAVQIVSFVFFYFVVYSCLGVFGMIRNSIYGMTLLGSVYTESFYWMALPVLVVAATLVTGPIFCGWICPTGTLQELAALARRRLAGGLQSRARPVLLGVFVVGFLALVGWLGTLKLLYVEDSSLHWGAGLMVLSYLVLTGAIDDLPTRSLRVLSLIAIGLSIVFHLVISSPMHFAFSSREDPASALTTAVVLIASLFVMRAWCRYLCPWGLVMGFLHRFSRLRVALEPSACNGCRRCDAACGVAAVERGDVRTEHCQMCLACVDVCPSKALGVVDVWALRARARERAAELDRA